MTRLRVPTIMTKWKFIYIYILYYTLSDHNNFGPKAAKSLFKTRVCIIVREEKGDTKKSQEMQLLLNELTLHCLV